MRTQSLGFIGGGRITRIILQAYQNKGVDFSSITVFEPNKETALRLKKQFPGITLSETHLVAAKQDIVFLAVHPPVMMETLEKIKKSVTGNTMVISLAPKISIEKMTSVLPTRKIVRMIPNATSFINKGYNPVSFAQSIAAKDKKFLTGILKVLGKTIVVKENMLEGYAIVSAMLPTYFWFQWKKMEEIAVITGFSAEDAKKVIRETLDRSIELYYKSDLSPDEVMDLIPVKPIGEHEAQIEEILKSKLLGLYEKIKP